MQKRRECRRKEEKKSAKNEGEQDSVMRVAMIKIHYAHLWKCHNEIHYVQIIYAKKPIFF